MAILINYDVGENKTAQMKAELKRMGYTDTMTCNQGKTVYLPNTTLFNKTKTYSEGLNDMKEAAKKVNATLDRAVSNKIDDNSYQALYGRPL